MIDETYIEFVPDVDELSAIPLTELFDNVIILRGTSKFFATPGPVSYTHLDVYKRQLVLSSGILSICNCVSSVFFLRLNNMRPVILFVFQNCFFFSALIATI